MANATISGTPTATGTFTFKIKATNEWGSDEKEFTIKILGIIPVITTTTLPDGRVGTAYNQTIAVTGTDPITVTKSTGTLPPGLTLS